MAASATLALKAGACVRRTRLVMVAPDPRHPRRSQAEFPLIDLSEFGRPPLSLHRAQAREPQGPEPSRSARPSVVGLSAARLRVNQQLTKVLDHLRMNQSGRDLLKFFLAGRAAGTSVTGTHGALMELSSSILLVADDAEARLLVGRTGGFPGPEEIDADLGGIQSPVRLRPRSDARRDSRGR